MTPSILSQPPQTRCLKPQSPHLVDCFANAFRPLERDRRRQPTVGVRSTAYDLARIHSIAEEVAVMNKDATVGHASEAEMLGARKAGHTRKLPADAPTIRATT